MEGPGAGSRIFAAFAPGDESMVRIAVKRRTEYDMKIMIRKERNSLVRMLMRGFTLAGP
jgi:hypothetical protein